MSYRNHALVMVAAMLLLLGCAGPPQPLYPGPERPREQVSLLFSADGNRTKVYAVDDIKVRGYSWHLEPGEHRVWVRIQMVVAASGLSMKAWSYCRLGFEAEPGASYRVRQTSSKRRTTNGVGGEMTVRIDGPGDELVSVLDGCQADPPG